MIGTEVAQDGFAVIAGVLGEEDTAELWAALEEAHVSHSVRRRGSVFAIRNLLEVGAVRALARDERMLRLVRPLFRGACFPVKATLFDKPPEANWLVPWHQDLTIAVRERVEAPGFGPWTEKAGVVHVQAPAEVLEGMLAVRVHLDECGPENGALRVVPGSHKRGRLSAEESEEVRRLYPAVTCPVSRGGVMLLRPLLLHSSSPAAAPGHRRVIHIEYADAELPGGLRWPG